MRTFRHSVVLATIVITWFYASLYAQSPICPFDNTLATNLPNQISLAGAGDSVVNSCVKGGEYVIVNVCIGAHYRFETCGSPGFLDSKITVYDSTGTDTLVFNDDACGPTGWLSRVTWVASYTGKVHVLVDQSAGTACLHDNNCYSLKVVQVTPCCDVPQIIVNDAVCNGTNTGWAVAIGAGTAPWDYKWKNSSGQFIRQRIGIFGPDTIRNLPAGNYSVIVEESGACIITQNFTINEPPPITDTIVTSDVPCNGMGNGSITLTVGGGTPPYGYLWSNNATTANLSNLNGGTYKVTITDANGCQKIDSATVNEPLPLTLSSSSNPVSCNGGNDGSVSVTVTGGTPGYSYLWSTVPPETTPSVSGLSAGTYFVVVTDNNNCIAADTVTVSQPPALSVTTGFKKPLCFLWTDGYAYVQVTGGVMPYAYQWNTTPVQTNDTAFNLGAGQYTVTVTDANNCTASATVNVTQPPPLQLTPSSTAAFCFGDSTGAAIVSVIGGTAPYAYLWNTNPPQTTPIAINVPAGSYSVTVTDNNGCQDSTISVVTEPPPLVASFSITDVSCHGGNDGEIDMTPSGGTPPYSYLWSTSATTQDITGLAAGTYFVTTTDNNNCRRIDTITVQQPPPLTATTTTYPTSCFGGNDGSAVVDASGGTPGYSYQWNTSPVQTSDSAIFLPAGTYTVLITDANGCTLTRNATVNEPPQIQLQTASIDAACSGVNNGAAIVIASGGTPGYTYVWGTNPVQTNDTAFNLGGGSYPVTVTDANGCTASTVVTVNQAPPMVLSPSMTPVQCFGLSNGTVSVAVSGGTPPYQYQWNTTPPATTATVNGVPAGFYTVTVTDANTCTALANIQVSEPAPLQLQATVNHVQCNGADNGSIFLTVTGGIQNYHFIWSNGDTTQNVTGLSPGQYIVNVFDANNCLISDTFLITQPTPITLSTTSTDVTCFGGSDGTATVTPSGGVPGYTYQWNTNPAQFTATAIGLQAGTHVVTVTDANGCTVATSVVVNEPPAIVPQITSAVDPTCNGGNDGSATVAVTGGNPGYTYQWSTIPVQGTPIATGLSAGTYTVTITDASGCTATASVTLNEPPAIEITATARDATCFGAADGSVLLNVTGGNPGYTFQWSTSPPQTTQNVSGLPSGSYTVSVTDASGCQVTETVTIGQPDEILINATSTPVSCFGYSDGALSISVSGGTPPYLYSWNNGATSANLLNLSPGIYTVTVTDDNGCTATDNVGVDEPFPFIVNAGPDTTIKLGTDIILHATTNGSGNIRFTWTPAATLDDSTSASPLADPEETTTYIVTAVNANGCADTDTITVFVDFVGLYAIPNVFTPNNDGLNDVLEVMTRADVTVTQFKIYNRWGKLLHDAPTGWDGTFEGELQPMDNYVYYVELLLPENKKLLITGDVTLVR